MPARYIDPNLQKGIEHWMAVLEPEGVREVYTPTYQGKRIGEQTLSCRIAIAGAKEVRDTIAEAA
jgi:hypothetical protein